MSQESDVQELQVELKKRKLWTRKLVKNLSKENKDRQEKYNNIVFCDQDYYIYNV